MKTDGTIYHHSIANPDTGTYTVLEKKLGDAYCAVAQYAPTLELRREFSRKAVLAGNQEARKIFPITVARFAADHQPLKVFKKEKSPAYLRTITSRHGTIHT